MSSNVLNRFHYQGAFGLRCHVAEQLCNGRQVATRENVLIDEATAQESQYRSVWECGSLCRGLPRFAISSRVQSLWYGDALKHCDAIVLLEQPMNSGKILCKMSLSDGFHHLYGNDLIERFCVGW